MNEKRIEKQLRKGLLEYAVLLILEKKAVYSSDILEKLSKAGLLTAEGTIYPLLGRLNKDDMVDYHWEESESGLPRKYYELTKKGNKKLSTYHKIWKSLLHSINF